MIAVFDEWLQIPHHGFEVVDIVPHILHGCIDFVCDPGGKLTNGFQLLSLLQLQLQQALFSDFCAQYQQSFVMDSVCDIERGKCENTLNFPS